MEGNIQIQASVTDLARDSADDPPFAFPGLVCKPQPITPRREFLAAQHA
jgi:hypothetical protein